MLAQLHAAVNRVQLDIADVPPVRATVRQQLRVATSAVHETLHAHPGFVSLLEERITLSAYRAMLARLYGFHWPLERGLLAAPPQFLREFNVRARERSPALRVDLRALGVSGPEIDALPICESLSPIHSYADLMGRLYVVEGSALGGRVMASKLDGILGAGNADGRQFLSGRAAPDPLPWPAFCRMLETDGVRSDIDAVIASAEATFSALADWLTGGEVHV